MPCRYFSAHMVFALLFITFFTTAEAQSELQDSCDVVSHTEFQLKLAGPFDDDSKDIINVTSVDKCSTACCDDLSCDAAVYIDKIVGTMVRGHFFRKLLQRFEQIENSYNVIVRDELSSLIAVNCVLVSCPSSVQLPIEDGPCQLQEAGDEDSALGIGLNTTVVYITHRSLNELQMPTVPVFNSIQKTTSFTDIVSNDTATSEWRIMVETQRNDTIGLPNNPNNVPEVVNEQTNNTLITNDSLVTNFSATSAHGENIITPVSPDSTAYIFNIEMTTIVPPVTTSEVSPTTTTISPTTTTISTTSKTISTTSTTIGIKLLKVNVSGTTEITLPEDSVELQALVDGTAEQSAGYNYNWELIDHPLDFEGKQSMHADRLSLSKLTAGTYQFKVTVTDVHARGEGYVNITVHEAFRVNQPPVAVISPDNPILTLPTDNIVLDGSNSEDDVKIETYHWEMKASPLQATEGKLQFQDDQQFLVLKDLVVGDYDFKLTVTDSDGATNSTSVHLVVKEKIDNKPIADAGGDQLIYLPQDSLELCGNRSTDDWGIVGYTWSLAPESKKQVVDMQGARTVCLQLSNLEAGEYTFQLTVRDERSQEDTAKVNVNVRPESNHPPVAVAGKSQQVILSEGDNLAINLDGSKSADDKGIKLVNWKLFSGPSKVVIANRNSLITSVTGLTAIGEYVFTLSVYDVEGESGSDTITVEVVPESPPVADAGPDVVLHLPNDLLVLDGSRSKDDYGIQSYLWNRDAKSPAVGRILNESDHQALFQVVGLREGSYIFHLTVTNIRGKSSADDVVVRVLADPLLSNLVEIHLSTTPGSFTEKDRELLVKQTSLLLSLSDADSLNVRSVFPEHHTGDLIVLINVVMADGSNVDANSIVNQLQMKLKSEASIVDAHIDYVDTYVCTNNCSGRGKCQAKECKCDVFWMENFFRIHIGDGIRNCDWSVLYFAIVTIFLILAICILIYLITWKLVRRRKNRRDKRRKRNYTQLPDNGTVMLKSSKNGITRKNGFSKHSQYRSSSLMRSMSSSSTSDQELALFEKRKLISSPHKRWKSKNKLKHDYSPLVHLNEAERDGSGDGFDGLGLDKNVSIRSGNSSGDAM